MIFHRSFRPFTPPSIRFTYWAVSLTLNDSKCIYQIILAPRTINYSFLHVLVEYSIYDTNLWKIVQVTNFAILELLVSVKIALFLSLFYIV